jgi:alanyl-tRNA synthetase
VRRIEAVTGSASLKAFDELSNSIERIAQNFKTSPERIFDRLAEISARMGALETELAQLKRVGDAQDATSLVDSLERVGEYGFIVANVGDRQGAQLRELADRVREKVPYAVAFLVSTDEGRLNVVCAAGSQPVSAGFNCASFIKEVTSQFGGGGGGRADMAQAGVKEASNCDGLIEAARTSIVEKLQF